jgi:transcriptional regulator with XRE-family HTH domain
MRLGEKLKYLRETEGELRGLGRAISQQEMVRALKAETGAALSQSYLSQIESGARPHLTNTSRLVLAKFFKVHPGYLVDDPEGYHVELQSDARSLEDKLDLWLVSGAERFRRDPELKQALLAVARHADSRRCLLLLNAVIDTPGLVDRLFEVLGPQGLKPRSSGARNGTAEAVPLQNGTANEAVAARSKASGERDKSAGAKARVHLRQLRHDQGRALIQNRDLAGRSRVEPAESGASGGAVLPGTTKATADPSAARVRQGEPASVGMTAGRVGMAQGKKARQ